MCRLERAIALLIGLLALAGCGDPEPETTSPSSSAPAASSPAPAAAAPAAAGAPVADDISAIRVAGASKDNAYNVGNADFMASLYEEDAILLPPTTSVAKGRAAIRRFLQLQFSQLADSGYTSEVDRAVEIRVSGNLGVRSGTYSTKDQSGGVVDTGKWLEVWNKAGDGKWRVSRDISNSDTLPLMLGMPEEEEQITE